MVASIGWHWYLSSNANVPQVMSPCLGMQRDIVWRLFFDAWRSWLMLPSIYWCRLTDACGHDLLYLIDANTSWLLLPKHYRCSLSLVDVDYSLHISNDKFMQDLFLVVFYWLTSIAQVHKRSLIGFDFCWLKYFPGNKPTPRSMRAGLYFCGI